MAGAKRTVYFVSDAMLKRFVAWSKSEEYRGVGVYQKAAATVRWLHNEGLSSARPMFRLLEALHESVKPGTNDGESSFRCWLVERVTECIERQYERQYEVAEAARTLLRSMPDEIESLAKGGE